MSEADIQAAILEYLRLRRHYVFRVNTQGVPIHRPGAEGRFRPSPMRGVSDILGIQHGTGRFIAVEVKSATGTVSEHQKRFIMGVEAAGGIALVARSVDDVRAAGL